MTSERRSGGHLRKRFGLAALFVTAALAGCATSGSGRAPSIENAGVLESILEPVFAGRDFQPLFDRLADSVVLEVTVSATPIRAARFAASATSWASS